MNVAMDEFYKNPTIEDIAPRGHQHCSRCVNARCPVPVSCETVSCKNGCEAIFHSCKEEDHLIICPKTIIGCPVECGATFMRCKFADHFLVCKNKSFDKDFPITSVRGPSYPCENGCGQLVKYSDQQDHDEFCSHRQVACLNATSGCKTMLSRHAQTKHLLKCPAAVYGRWGPDTLRRDEYSSSMELNNPQNKRFSSKCFMCSFTYVPLKSKVPPGTVQYDESQGCHVLVPDYGDWYIGLLDGSTNRCSTSLLSLPREVLQMICRRLDSLSLLNLSMTCRAIRDAAASLLCEKGVVSLEWTKEGSKDFVWTAQKMVWTFSKVTTAVRRWTMTDPRCYMRHVGQCQTYQNVERVVHNKPFCLLPTTESHDKNT